MIDDKQPLTRFSEYICTQDNGLVEDELTAALAAVVEAVQRMERKGKLTLELTVEPAGSGGRYVTTRAKVTAKPPEPVPAPSIFFVGNQGSLHREDPYQRSMLDDTRQIDVDDEPRTIPQED